MNTTTINNERNIHNITSKWVTTNNNSTLSAFLPASRCLSTRSAHRMAPSRGRSPRHCCRTAVSRRRGTCACRSCRAWCTCTEPCPGPPQSCRRGSGCSCWVSGNLGATRGRQLFIQSLIQLVIQSLIQLVSQSDSQSVNQSASNNSSATICLWCIIYVTVWLCYQWC